MFYTSKTSSSSYILRLDCQINYFKVHTRYYSKIIRSPNKFRKKLLRVELLSLFHLDFQIICGSKLIPHSSIIRAKYEKQF